MDKPAKIFFRKWGCSAIYLSDNQVGLVGGSRNSKEADILTRGAAGAWNWRSIALGIANLNRRILVARGRCSDVELLAMPADDPRDLGQWTLLSPLSRVYEGPYIASFSGKILLLS